MPWKELPVVHQRLEFVLKALSGEVGFTELCRQQGIAPKTGYKWKQRFLEQGMAGLGDLSRRPASSPGELSEAVVCRIIRLRHAHPTWGPRKLQELYRRMHGQVDLPSESSFKRILDKAGLVVHRVRRPASTAGALKAPRIAEAPNALWTVDFKGWWYTSDHKRCLPLTVRDAYSRYVLCASVPQDAKTPTIRQAFETLFNRYGLPETIRSDNGAPFANYRSPLGLSQLSAWWVALGIDLDRTDPGHPEQNGAHERMHRDIATEVQAQASGDLHHHAAALELWRKTYNELRPHEALNMKTPAELYHPSARTFQGTPHKLDYAPGMIERKVQHTGTIGIHQRHIHISHALSGWHVGLKPQPNNVYTVYFGKLPLGILSPQEESFTPHNKLSAQPPPPEP